MSYEEEDTCMPYEEEDTCMPYEEEDTCMPYEEEDTCMSCEEEDTCMSYEEEDTWITKSQASSIGSSAGSSGWCFLVPSRLWHRCLGEMQNWARIRQS
jgi:hypothetical protein